MPEKEPERTLIRLKRPLLSALIISAGLFLQGCNEGSYSVLNLTPTPTSEPLPHILPSPPPRTPEKFHWSLFDLPHPEVTPEPSVYFKPGVTPTPLELIEINSN